MLRIWGRTNSLNVQKVLWTAEELGLAYERVDAGGPFGVVDTAEYATLNPNRLVPTIEDDGFVLWESNAIVRYLAAKHGAGTLWPEDPAARADSDRWMDWTTTTVGAPLGTVFWGLIRTPPDERDAAAIRAAAEKLGTVFAIADRVLGERAFIAGDKLTIGDIPLGTALHRWMALDVERPRLARLEAYYGRLTGRAPYQKAVMPPLS